MLTVQKFLIMSAVNVVSAMGMICIIKSAVHQRCFVKCTTAAARKEAGTVDAKTTLDRVAACIDYISEYLKKCKTSSCR